MSLNPCGLKQRFTDMFCKCGMVPNQVCHSTCGILSSHPSFFLHRYWTMVFAQSVIGDTSPRGSNMELTIGGMPRRMSGRSATLTTNLILSSFTSQFMPKARSLDSASQWFRFTTEGALSDTGIAQRTFLLLLSHFVSLKPPIFISDCKLNASFTAPSSVRTDLRQSST